MDKQLRWKEKLLVIHNNTFNLLQWFFVAKGVLLHQLCLAGLKWVHLLLHLSYQLLIYQIIKLKLH